MSKNLLQWRKKKRRKENDKNSKTNKQKQQTNKQKQQTNKQKHKNIRLSDANDMCIEIPLALQAG